MSTGNDVVGSSWSPAATAALSWATVKRAAYLRCSQRFHRGGVGLDGHQDIAMSQFGAASQLGAVRPQGRRLSGRGQGRVDQCGS